MKAARIGLQGGTFDPVHLGHIRAAVAARRRFRLDRVLLIPSAVPPHKEYADTAPPEHRLRMVKMACRGRTGLEASALEIEAGGTSYSFRTLEEVGRRRPEAVLFFLLGIDAFLEIRTWREYRRVLKQCHFIVTGRPGFDLALAPSALTGETGVRFIELGPEGSVVGPLPDEPSVFLMPLDALDISSTDIRSRVRRGEALAGLVPEPVEKYIKRHGLYRGAGGQ
ncbi:MAG: nicotinate (nicotinamide) nucleotide adenylyltransferase [Candidatus Aminicenantes bacterium]|nr:nicotinate (nicotinamide) nucleotide adenylyltransferase [Candidatus Aminicenantes bacterium]